MLGTEEDAKYNAALSIFFDSGLNKHNSFLDDLKMLEDKTEYSAQYPSKLSNFGNYPKDFEMNMDKFMMDLDVSSYYTYEGSITEPPCT